MDFKLIAGCGVLLAIAMALTACHPKRHPDDSLPVAQTISRGDALVLLRPLSVSVGMPAIVFQDGQRIQTSELRPTSVYCQLRFSEAPPGPDAVEPQVFDVTDVVYHERKGTSGATIQVTELRLSSTKTPGTETMTCRWPEGPAASAPITPEEIAAALQGYFSIRNA